MIVVKFSLQISQEKQVAFKRFKTTEEDWRNRDKCDAYQQAICDRVDRTITGNAPWTLVEANDKNFARVKILRTLCERLEAELNGPALPCALSGAAKKVQPEKADKRKKSGKKPKAKAKDRSAPHP